MRIVVVCLLILAGCQVKPEAISYGRDACAFCKMNIVDQAYGSELVTTKGKVFKFDAVECMINYQQENNLSNEELAHVVVNAFDDRGELGDASAGTYLRSRELPSPMGMFITPFRSADKANEARSSKGGTLYTWTQLLEEFETLPNLTE